MPPITERVRGIRRAGRERAGGGGPAPVADVPGAAAPQRPDLLRRAAVSNVGTWLQLTAMSLLVYDLTGQGDRPRHHRRPAVPADARCSGRGAAPWPTASTSGAMAIVTQAMLAVQALVLGVVVLAGVGHRPDRVGAHAGRSASLNAFENPARRGLVTELVEPGRHRQRHLAEHRGDDGLAHLRPGARRAARRHRRHGVVLPAQRGVVRRRADLAVRCCARDQLYPPPLHRPRRPAGPRRARLRAPQPPAVRDVRRDGDRVDVRLQLRRRPAQARRRALGRRELVRARAVGDAASARSSARCSRPGSTSITMRWYLGFTVLLGVGRHRDGVGAEPVVGAAVGRAARDRRRRLHQRRQRDRPAGEPARHARPAARPDRRRLPRLDADRRPDHRHHRRRHRRPVGAGLRQHRSPWPPRPAPAIVLARAPATDQRRRATGGGRRSRCRAVSTR